MERKGEMRAKVANTDAITYIQSGYDPMSPAPRTRLLIFLNAFTSAYFCMLSTNTIFWPLFGPATHETSAY